MRRRYILFVPAGVGVLAAVLVLTWLHSGTRALYSVVFLPTMGGVEVRAHAPRDCP